MRLVKLLLVLAFLYFTVSCLHDEIIIDKETECENIHQLKGEIIGTDLSFDISSGEPSTCVNTIHNVFDGDASTFFMSYDSCRTWVGLDLGKKHIIKKVGFIPREGNKEKVELALFEGANDSTFNDAVPIAMVKEVGNYGYNYININCSKGFRYIRYVSPYNAHCQIAEIVFYGLEDEGDDSQFYQLTNLPTVIINTADRQDVVSKTEEILSYVSIVSNDGHSLLSTKGTKIRGRGNYSWGLPKKPYRIKFSEKQSPLGAPSKAKKWTLINNYGDKTLMRNILAFEVSRRIGMSYTPFCTPVDVIVNGEYQGCYQFCDQVEVGSNRVEAKNGYLIEIDAYAHAEKVFFTSNRGVPVTVKYPDDDKISPQQLEYIRDFFNLMEESILGIDYTNAAKEYLDYLDLNSFLKNFIVGEFCGNTDTFWSVNMYKDSSDGVFYTGPVWDYDLAFENDDRTYPINELPDFIYSCAGSVASPAVREMVNRIVKKDVHAREQLKAIWNETKGKLANLCEFVDETAMLLDESQKLNFMRWPILNEKVHQNFQATGSYSLEVETVKKYITDRLRRMDELVNAD